MPASPCSASTTSSSVTWATTARFALRPGWPNGVDELQHPVRAPDLAHGRFNSPHGLAVDADGSLYVAEWLIGGRMIKLAPAAG